MAKQFTLTIDDDGNPSIGPYPPVTTPIQKRILGTNLESLESWMQDRPGINIAGKGSGWVLYREGTWTKVRDMVEGEVVPTGHIARRTLLDGGQYQKGEYTLKLADEQIRTIMLQGDNFIIDRKAGQVVVPVVYFGISDSETVYKDWLSDLKRYGTVRFMDWQQTNKASKPQPWRDTSATIKTLVDAGIPAWVCIHATEMIFNVPAGVKFIESSNEVWNGQFPQGPQTGVDFATHMSRHLGKTRQVQKYAESIGARGVLGGWHYSPWWTDKMLTDARTQGWKPDYVAIGAYWGHDLEDDIANFSNGAIDNAIDLSLKLVREHKVICDRFGVKLACYEAGQHITKNGGVNCNRDERMYNAYLIFFTGLFDIMGDDAVICSFAKTGTWGKFGSWGEREVFGVNTAKSKAIDLFKKRV